MLGYYGAKAVGSIVKKLCKTQVADGTATSSHNNLQSSCNTQCVGWSGTLSYNNRTNSCKTQVAGAAATLPLSLCEREQLLTSLRVFRDAGEGVIGCQDVKLLSVLRTKITSLFSLPSCHLTFRSSDCYPLPQSLPQGREAEKRASRFTLHSSLKKQAAFTLAEGATHVAHFDDIRQAAVPLVEGNTHVAHFDKIRRAAFTLAEVLITLGIIGVVAAMTMPVLIQNHKKSEATARLKKFYSTMSQAILLSENDNGPAKQWTKADNIAKDPDTGLYDDADAVNTEIYFNTYLKNYLKYLKTEKDEDTNLFKVMMNDGSSFLMRNGNCIDFIFDYNGDKYPNKEGRDRYRFVICPAGYQFNANKNLSFSVYAQAASTTRTQRLSNCKSDPRYCVGLLELDNWEFKSDYPYRL